MKVLIVDDEVIIRRGLSTVINWEELGFELLSPAASAEEALKRIPTERPHIVLTDIQMTGMNGLELTAEVKRLLPDTEVIILTGYDDFAYAQQAIRGGVSDYLLKMSPPKEIIKAAMQAKQRIVSRWDLAKQDRLQQTAFRNRLLEQLLTDTITDSRVIEQIPPLLPKLASRTGPIQVMIAVASGWGEGNQYADALHFAVQNMIAELLPCETLLRKDSVLIVYCHRNAEPDLHKAKLSLEIIARKLNCELFAAAGTPVDHLSGLNTSYAEAQHTLAFQGLLNRERPLLTYEEVKGRKGGRTICTKEEEDQLIALLKAGSSIELRQWVRRVIDAQLTDEELTPASMLAYVGSIYISGHRWLERIAMSLGQAKALPEQHLPSLRELGERPHEGLFLPLQTLMDKYQALIAGGQLSYITLAIAFIREHLDKSLTLQHVAKHVHLNPNHFSEVFKRETGMTYIEFVTKERMQKAMELLNETPAKISEVARLVGYEDVKYFSQLFKKTFGKTPSECRTTS
ncbi:MAG: hypothetical protein K0Q59_3349 [Paenibacillus sp.]|nr:hypothetical protein [Paenibacillus sp.]